MSAHIKNAKMGTLQLPSPAMVNTHRPRSHVKTRRPRTYVPKRESLSMDTFLSNTYNKDVKRRLLCDLLSYCFISCVLICLINKLYQIENLFPFY